MWELLFTDIYNFGILPWIHLITVDIIVSFQIILYDFLVKNMELKNNII